MKVLVIDDREWNRQSARRSLAEHALDVVSTVSEAYTALRSTVYDAVLTDLHMPVDDFKGAFNTRDHDRPTGLFPAGLVFALKAANTGARVVICSDGDHHNDFTCALLDLLADEDGDTERVDFVEARSVPYPGYWDAASGALIDGERGSSPRVKDWSAVMNDSDLFPELS